MAVTIYLLIEPASTISTTSTVSLVGDAQAAAELGLDIEPLEQRADLRAAAMHHDRVHAGLLEQHDVAGEIGGERRIAHGVTAIFHHDLFRS